MVRSHIRSTVLFAVLIVLLITLTHKIPPTWFHNKKAIANGHHNSALLSKAHYRKDCFWMLEDNWRIRKGTHDFKGAENLRRVLFSAERADLTDSNLKIPSSATGSKSYPNQQLSYKIDFSRGYFRKLDTESRIHCGMLEFLDVINPSHALSSVREADISDVVVVSAIDKSHYDDLAYMCTSMREYKKFGSRFERRLIVFLLGTIKQNELEILAELCNFIEFRLFPYHLFPDCFREILHFRFKPAVIALMLKEYYVVYWMDSSNRFNGSANAISFEEYFGKLKERNIPLAMSDTAGHSILATTQPTMYEYLPIEDIRKEVDVGLAGTLLVIGTKEVKSTILLRLLQCAFIPQCMAPDGHRLECSFKDRYKEYANCHRYDLSALNIIANLYTNNRTDRYIVPFEAISIRRHRP